MKGPTIRRGARVGGGAILCPGIEIGEEAFVGAGAVVTKDVPPRTVVVGNPARVLREVPDDELLDDPEARRSASVRTTERRYATGGPRGAVSLTWRKYQPVGRAVAREPLARPGPRQPDAEVLPGEVVDRARPRPPERERHVGAGRRARARRRAAARAAARPRRRRPGRPRSRATPSRPGPSRRRAKRAVGAAAGVVVRLVARRAAGTGPASASIAPSRRGAPQPVYRVPARQRRRGIRSAASRRRPCAR